MIDIRNRKIGLVLSGGGAKGAYQVGMFRALEELGVAGHITAMSGCSIGAYAAVITAIRGYGAYRDFLYAFPELIGGGAVLPDEAVEAARRAVAAGEVSLGQFLSQRRFWKYVASGLQAYIGELLTGWEARVCPRLSVCCYSLEAERPVYFDLSRLSNAEKQAAIIGSGSLPFLFAPRAVGGCHCLDGGVVPSICRAPAPPDKIPLRPLAAEDVEFILVNFLIAQDSADISAIPAGTPHLELRPSAPLEASPGAGTLDFSPDKLRSHEEMGYADTLDLLRENCIF